MKTLKTWFAGVAMVGLMAPAFADTVKTTTETNVDKPVTATTERSSELKPAGTSDAKPASRRVASHKRGRKHHRRHTKTTTTTTESTTR